MKLKSSIDSEGSVRYTLDGKYISKNLYFNLKNKRIGGSDEQSNHLKDNIINIELSLDNVVRIEDDFVCKHNKSQILTENNHHYLFTSIISKGKIGDKSTIFIRLPLYVDSLFYEKKKNKRNIEPDQYNFINQNYDIYDIKNKELISIDHITNLNEIQEQPITIYYCLPYVKTYKILFSDLDECLVQRLLNLITLKGFKTINTEEKEHFNQYSLNNKIDPQKSSDVQYEELLNTSKTVENDYLKTKEDDFVFSESTFELLQYCKKNNIILWIVSTGSSYEKLNKLIRICNNKGCRLPMLFSSFYIKNKKEYIKNILNQFKNQDIEINWCFLDDSEKNVEQVNKLTDKDLLKLNAELFSELGIHKNTVNKMSRFFNNEQIKDDQIENRNNDNMIYIG